MTTNKDIEIVLTALEKLFLRHCPLNETDAKEAIIVASALTRIESALAEREWQPIETAPRDGTRVLVEFDSGSRYCQAFFRHEYKKWVEVGYSTMWLLDVTRWQPLPPAPKGEKE